MRWKTSFCIVNIFCLVSPCAGRAAAPNETSNSSGPRPWVRREAHVAKVLPDQLAALRTHVSRSPAMRPVLEQYGVKNQNLFMIELEPKEYYALRYQEYSGRDRASDTQRLEQDRSYKQWADKLDACLADGWADVQCVFFTDGQLRSTLPEDRVERLGRVVGLRPNMADSYVLLHQHTWPGVLSAIREGNIRNYSIFLAPIGSNLYLFAYLEYVGSDFESDMTRIGSDPDTKAWIKFTDDGCQLPISTRKPGEWWASMERL
jgi:L-rhamnose mutarotase